MSKINLSDFENAMAFFNFEIEFRKDYHWRCDFKGHGFVVDSMAEAIQAAALLGESFEGLGNHRPHVDNMGRGYIVAWPERIFWEASP
jgi:hypothetical protein